MSVADADMIMPPKSTWFEPKPRSGLIMRVFEWMIRRLVLNMKTAQFVLNIDLWFLFILLKVNLKS